MSKKYAYTAAEVIAALKEARGYVSKAASILGCTPVTVYNYRNNYPTVAEAWKSIREERHDFVENALHKRIQAGSDTAIIFYLKTQAKDRGYIERQEVYHDLSAELLKLFQSGTLTKEDIPALQALGVDVPLPGIEA